MRHGNSLARVCVLLVVVTAAAGAARAQEAPVEIEGWDLSVLDEKIAAASARAAAPGAGASDKRAAASAYLARANVFFHAGQPALYKLALGDFRRALRFQPDNEEAREKAELITSIYESLLRPVPPNGGETDAYNDPRLRYRTKPAPVKLSPGGQSASLTASPLPDGVAYVYEIELRAGQRLGLSLAADDGAARFDLARAGASPLASRVTEWEGAAPDAGKYLIKVSTEKGAAGYTLEVKVR